MSRRLPYPGLRRFQPSETDLFFGRNKESSTIVKLLTANRFLGVLGASGSGKSSLVFTRLIQALEGGANTVGSAWQIADFRPKGEPIANLAKALVKASNPSAEAQSPETVAERLRASPRAIVQWCEDGNLAPGHALLIIADQFEELFNYNTREARDEAHALASLLVESAHSREAPIYVVLTMRSDYFGHCSAFPQLAQAISDSIFLTPRMLRDQCKLAIEGPAGVSGFTIRKDLLIRLLNDLERLATFDPAAAPGGAQAMPQADQLPLLQYALNSMWRRVEPDVPANEDVVLKLEHYVGDGGIGGIEGALDNQGKATLEMLAAVGVPQEQVERVFRALVKGSDVSSAVRDPHRIRRVARIAGLDIATVTSIVSAFAADDCQFLDLAQPVDDASFVDISHESLIRQWGLLRGWLTREAEAAETWRSLARDATDWRRSSDDPEALLRGAQLADRNAWWRAERPTDAWVERYPVEDKDGKPVPGEVVGEYLDAGIAARDSAREDARKRQQRRKLLGAGAFSLVTVGSLLWAADRQQTLEEKALLLTQVKLERDKALTAERIAVVDKIAAQAARRSAFREAGKARAAEKTANEKEARAKAAERLAQISGQDALRQASAANAANQKLLGNLVVAADVLDEQQARPDGSASAIKRTALALINGLDPVAFGQVLPKYQEILARAEIAGIGADKSRGEGAKDLQSLSRNLSGRPYLAAYLQGQAAELNEDFPTAARSYTASFSGPGDDDLKIRYEAAAALIRIGRFVGKPGPAAAAAWCKDRMIELRKGRKFPGTGTDNDVNGKEIAAYRCLAAAAFSDAVEEEERLGLIDELNNLEWPSDESAEEDERRLDRLRLRADIAVLNVEIDFDQLTQVELHQRANPGSEAVANLLARLYSGDDSDPDQIEQGLGIRRPFLERPGAASAAFLLDSLPGLLKLDANFEGESEGPALSDADITPQAIENVLKGLDANRLLSGALGELDRRHAPELPPGEEGNRRDRVMLIPQIRTSGEQWRERLCRRLAGLANWNGLARDLHANDVYLSKLDLLQVVALLGVNKALTSISTRDEKLTACIDANSPIKEKLQIDEVKQLVASGVTDDLLTNFPADTQSLPADQLFRLDGRDPVALYRADDAARAAAAPVRGRKSITFEHAGGTYLFDNPTNRNAFQDNPAGYLPAFESNAADWLEIGERRLGNHRFSCLVDGKLILFETHAKRNACANAANAGAYFRELEELWRASKPMPDLAKALLVLKSNGEPVSQTGRPTRTGALQFNYQFDGAAARIVALAGGRVNQVSAAACMRIFYQGSRFSAPSTSILRIEHADGSLSCLGLTGPARFINVNRGSWLRRDETIAYTGSVSTLHWTIIPPPK